MRIELVRGDITREGVDAIVNAANSSLLGGGGVDGAIHQAAGPKLLAECQELRRTTLPHGLPVGQAVATGAGELPCRWVIHTVGPNRHAGQTNPDLLRSCFTASLRVADQIGVKSLAFPAISAGVYGWAADQVAVAARAALDGATSQVNLVRFVLFNVQILKAFREAFADSAAAAPR
ncbi:MAG: O-acetyl-ADP-ribose deacetylase [Bifidobacteriaceae bacterium]|jgi:O-acetyl-ADP-ribose deacetylase (regulator of RNase III)|nr:O-acetyl-ADP-ribose deacetylase [Bifidobacteriaceae bacterium]